MTRMGFLMWRWMSACWSLRVSRTSGNNFPPRKENGLSFNSPFACFWILPIKGLSCIVGSADWSGRNLLLAHDSVLGNWNAQRKGPEFSGIWIRIDPYPAGSASLSLLFVSLITPCMEVEGRYADYKTTYRSPFFLYMGRRGVKEANFSFFTQIYIQ